MTNTVLAPVIELLATKYRTKKGFLRYFTTLHMMVMTHRCNHRCKYCHASSEDADKRKWDMSLGTVKNCVDIIFQTPSPSAKIEFQGGEPSLNMEAVEYTVNYAKKLNKERKKDLTFVLCTNLASIDEDTISFIKENDILVSSSLDGPKELHDENRVLRYGRSSYEAFVSNLEKVRSSIGHENVSALMTTTMRSLDKFPEIIDEYVRQGFQGIFLRSLNPYGYAKKDEAILGYDISQFVEAYRKGVEHIIDLNLKGISFVEYFASLLLSRMLTPFATGFVDLQSPAGSGICGVIYDHNGDVYPSDEARMLAKMGDRRFLLGNVNRDSFTDIFNSETLKEMTSKSCLEVIPGCATCAFQPYCGADPVRNYSTQGDVVGHQPTSESCEKNKGIIEYLFGLIEKGNEDVIDVFWSWITNRSLNEVRGESIAPN